MILSLLGRYVSTIINNAVDVSIQINNILIQKVIDIISDQKNHKFDCFGNICYR